MKIYSTALVQSSFLLKYLKKRQQLNKTNTPASPQTNQPTKKAPSRTRTIQPKRQVQQPTATDTVSAIARHFP